MIHVVDIYPTLIGLAGAHNREDQAAGWLDMWPTISEGKPSPRTEVVYNIEPFRAGVREGDWKLIWRTPLPQVVELYNIAQDPSRRTTSPPRIRTKSRSCRSALMSWPKIQTKPFLLQIEFGEFRKRLAVPPALPGEEFQLEFEQ